MRTSRLRRSKRTTISRSSLRLPFGAAAFLLGLTFPISPAPSQEPQEQEAQRVHVVRRGDTLWDLARLYLNDPFLWPEIYRLNTTVVEDPHWIFPEEVLRLPGPVEAVAAVPAEAAPPETALAALPAPPVLEERAVRETLTIFAGRTLAEREGRLIYQPAAEVPATAVPEGDFRRSGWLAPLDEVGPTGRVLDLIQPSAVRLELPANIGAYDRFYMSFPGDRPPVEGEQYLLFRVEGSVGPWGVVARPTGLATVAAVGEDVATGVLVESYDRVVVGDRAVRAQPFAMEPGVFPRDVTEGPQGRIVALLDPQPLPSGEDIVFINLGRRDGVVEGDEFEVYLEERGGRAGHTYPEERIATGRVVRVMERTATLRIVTQRHAALQRGLPVRLIRKMP